MAKKLLWLDGPKLRLFEVPQEPSKLLNPKAWKISAEFDLDQRSPIQYGAISSDGTMAALGGNDLLIFLNLISGKSLAYSVPESMIKLRWSQDRRYLIGSYFQPNKGGGSVDLAAIRIDPASISHSGSIDWNNPQSITPQILLDMPIQTKAIMWSE